MAARVLSRLFHRLRPSGQTGASSRSSVIEEAEVLWSAGRVEEALRAIAVVTDDPRADTHALGLHAQWLAMRGQFAESRRLFDRMTAIAPELPDGWLGLGNLARMERGAAEALPFYERARERAPLDRGILRALVLARQSVGDHDGAVAAAGEGVSPDDAGADDFSLYGQTLHAARRLDEAERAWCEALARTPDHLETLVQLGMHYCGRKAFGRARPLLERAIGLPGAPALAWANLAIVYRSEGRFGDALLMAEHAASLGLDLPEARMDRGMLLLALQRFEEGWPLYEARFEVADLPSAVRADAGAPWRGEPLEGRSILVWAEQGAGDTFQFARYVRLLEARGARVFVEAQPAAVRLLSVSGVGAAVRPVGADWRDVAPEFHCAMMSLPYRFGTTHETIPWPGPYLSAPRENRFHQAFEGTSELRVGFVWAGNPAQASDWARSVPWESIAPLTRIPGIVAVPLQMGEAGAEWRGGDDVCSVDVRQQLHDFADTAALIACLDIVVTVCTSVAHLSGAMGRETFVLLAHAADWRWLPGPDRTPWYPTATLFRCPAPGDWPAVMAEAGKVLTLRVRAGNGRPRASATACVRGASCGGPRGSD